jgi:hypothetical protein
MNTADRVKFLRIALIVSGLIFLVGVYPLTILWPAGWAWHHAGQTWEYFSSWHRETRSLTGA